MKKLLIGALAVVMIIGMTACGAKSELADLTGSYQDQESQRAALMLEKTDGDNYKITIDWATSATEQIEWTATGTFDGDKIEYTDGEKHEIEYNDNGDVVKNDVTAKDQKGVLTVGTGLEIEWQGAEEDETANFIQVAL